MNFYWLSFFLIIIGIIFIISGPVTYISIINNVKIQLKNSYIISSLNSKNFDYIDIYTTLIYSWNVTNSENVLKGEQPIFEVNGPYYYDYQLITNNPSFSEDETSFSFERNFFYQPNTQINNNSVVQNMTTMQIGYLAVLYAFGISETEIQPSLYKN